MSELMVIVCISFDHRSDIEGLKKFKSCISACSHVETAIEVSGTFDLIVHARAATLTDYTTEMERIAPQMREFVDRVETNFVSRVQRKARKSRWMWVPCTDGRKRIETHMINKVEAEGDYMRLHFDGWSCLLHDTMAHLIEIIGLRDFIQIHRSIVVRNDYIERLTHHSRRWIARLRDGSEHRVAKSHVPDILRLMNSASSINGADPTSLELEIDKALPVNELVMPEMT